MTCEACVYVVVQIVTGLPRTIFSGANDRLTQFFSYVESYEYVEVYVGA